MSTRRIVSDRKTLSEEKNDFSPEEKNDFSPDEKSNITPAVPATVIYKLLAFTLAMFAGPILTYFLSLKTIFRGNSTFAGATAAIMANVVLISYVVMAFQDDQTETLEAAEKEKKSK